METTEKKMVTVRAGINAPEKLVWKLWTTPSDVEKWNNTSPDWFTPWAENDLREGGKFNYRMEAKDGSAGFNFHGDYLKIIPGQLIEFITGDNRYVKIEFRSSGELTEVIESFEIENTNPVEMQRRGWQAILDNFKNYAETEKQ